MTEGTGSVGAIKNPVLVGAGRGNHQYETLVDISWMQVLMGLHNNFPIRAVATCLLDI
jgi:hypothetical protein